MNTTKVAVRFRQLDILVDTNVEAPTMHLQRVHLETAGLEVWGFSILNVAAVVVTTRDLTELATYTSWVNAEFMTLPHTVTCTRSPG